MTNDDGTCKGERGCGTGGLSKCNAATPGPHTVRFEVDTDEDVTELDETNNFLEKVFVWCGGEELCNSIDDDCDGETDEGFPIGDACDGPDADGCENGQNACGEDGAIVCVEEGDPAVEACNGEDGVVTGEAGAGAEELCNGVDDDCDGEIDEDFVQLGASCAVGTGVCRAVGTYVCLDGAAKCDAVAGAPAASENCGDGLDNDCDGLVEETCPCDEGTYLLCGSTVGECTVGVQVCDGGVFASTCEDAVKAGSESCGDADDNDCDGVVDEGCPCVAGDSRPCGGPGACAASVQHCVQGLWGPCIGVAPTLEACDGKDDVDDGCPCAGGVEACDQAPDSCADYARECNDGVWSACAAVEGTEDPDCFGDGGATTGDPGTGDAGTGDPGTGDTGTGDTGTGDPGTGDPGTGATGDPGTGGTGDAGDGDTAGDGAGDGPEPGPGASPPTEDSGCTAGRGDRGWGLVFLFGLFGLAVLRFREPA